MWVGVSVSVASADHGFGSHRRFTFDFLVSSNFGFNSCVVQAFGFDFDFISELGFPLGVAVNIVSSFKCSFNPFVVLAVS